MNGYVAAAQSGPVRVSRNGNARTLAVPAEIAKRAHIEVGDQYMVEAFGNDLVFRRVNSDRLSGHFVGEGASRVLELPRGSGMTIGPDPEVPELIDWDF
ncbi:MAG: AbrB/MazE/SpoVT family DNA-binding domain-containing protein [Dehalococcoidia bacterium]|nr:AbrB/MazE/SpoVT family DNA-binding domain-containing protein [Dehalococcoidia bacterium]